MPKLLPFILLSLFLAALIPRLGQSIAQSSALPEWSTMRSDPLGAKVLFEALKALLPQPVERNFEPWEQTASRRAQYVLLGVSPLLLRDVKPLEHLLQSGGIVLLALRAPAGKVGLRTERYGFLHHRDEDRQPSLILRDDTWICVLGRRESCRLAEKKLGQGRVWLLADAAPLSNRALHEHRDTSLLVSIFGAGLPVVFDESHLGVTDTGGVGTLLRRYRLLPALGLLLIVGLLYIWRNSVSMLPERQPVEAAMTPQPAASLRTLLSQNIPRSKILDTIVTEWRRALHLLPAWQAGRGGDVDAALELAKQRKDPRTGYMDLQDVMRLRKENR